MKGTLLFPAAYLALTSALTVLLIVLGLTGRAALAAEFAVAQGALLATFFAFSANTRNLILHGHDALTPGRLLIKRVMSLPLLGIAAYVLAVWVAGVSPWLAFALVVRRACEWLAEVVVCEIEVAADATRARRVLTVQAVTTLATATVLVVVPALEVVALALFAISPLIGASPRLRGITLSLSELRETLRGVSAHVGSTAIIGVTVYLLRLIVYLLAEVELAGYLFTGFAIGSFAATLFANVLGPTLALQRTREAEGLLVRVARNGTWVLAGLGVALTAAALAMGAAGALGRPQVFWLALGFSFLGAVVMVAAQWIRLRLFDRQVGEILFGPDVLRCLTLLIATPLLFHGFGAAGLAGVYLVDGLLTLAFYAGIREWRAGAAVASRPWMLALIAGLIVLPLFFLLSGRLYHAPGNPLLDSGGAIMGLPLPVSLLACFAGTLLLGRYRASGLALGTIFFFFVAMVFATIVATDRSDGYESRKLLLLFQYLVPTFALILGQMIDESDRALRFVGAGFLAVICSIIPANLMLSIGYGYNELSHNMVIFSIYQHRQFVPVTLVGAYLVAVYALWDYPLARRAVLVIAPAVGLYTAASYSTLALGLLVIGCATMIGCRRRERLAYLLAALALGAVAVYLVANRAAPPFKEKYVVTAPEVAAPTVETAQSTVKLPVNITRRASDWVLFGGGIMESPQSALFGHARTIPREVTTSAHNYYLDFGYNFGLVGFLPLGWLIGYTLLLLWRRRRDLVAQLPLLGLALVVMFLIFGDNNFKVAFRQPYPGIFAFFAWGLLLSRLRAPSRSARP